MINRKTNARELLCTVGLVCLIGAAVTAGLAHAGEKGDSGAAAKPRTPAKLPQIISIRVHADWCAACKKLDGVYPKLKEQSSSLPVLFVTFDLTDKATTQQAQYLASLLGVDRVLSEQGGKVGRIVLVDAKHKRTLKSLPATNNLEKIEQALRKALASSRDDD